MTASVMLVEGMKQALKAQGLTYAKVAKGLGMSETSVKRMFSRCDFPLKRLDRLLDLAGIELEELTRGFKPRDKLLARLTPQQERTLAADTKLMLVAIAVMNRLTLQKIASRYAISEPECIRLLVRLDRLGIIRLLPGNRVRVLLAQSFTWLPDGPMDQFFKSQRSDFLQSRFDRQDELLLYVTGRLSKTARDTMLARLRRVIADFSDLHRGEDETGASGGGRVGVSLLIAFRPWEMPAFAALRRKS
jgi:hypothetical protein